MDEDGGFVPIEQLDVGQSGTKTSVKERAKKLVRRASDTVGIYFDLSVKVADLKPNCGG